MENQCSAERPCVAVQLLVQKTNDHDEDIKFLRDRLPPWVMWAGTGAGALIGVLATLASK